MAAKLESIKASRSQDLYRDTSLIRKSTPPLEPPYDSMYSPTVVS